MTRSAPPRAIDARRLEREAAAALDEALAVAATLHRPGVRLHHQLGLERALDLSGEVLALAAAPGVEGETIAGARRTQVLAHCARAEHSRYGAGQLSRGSQRAPTSEDCEDGWRRVESIVATAEASALEARRMAVALDDPRLWKAVRAAEGAAKEARRIVDERNHAYTFHADPAFSFGEGWYLAAAAVLAGATIQVEPDKPQTAQVRRFLLDAGLAPQLVPYRSRPRANKALPSIVARAFLPDPLAAQARLRAAFLGPGPVAPAVADWTDAALAGAPAGKTVLLWLRHAAYHPMRNSTRPEVAELCRRALEADLVPVLIGDALREGELPPGAVDLTLFWKLPLFQGEDMRRAQLQLFEHMRRAHGLVGQCGVTTAGMDGPALMGLDTLYITEEANVRLGTWVGAVPGYEEVVRDEAYLERISRAFERWRDGGRRRMPREEPSHDPGSVG